MFDEQTEKHVYSLVEKAVENENFRKYVLCLRSTWKSGPIDYIRVAIYGRDHNMFLKKMDLLVKTIRTERAVRMRILNSWRRAFTREIFIYQHVFPMMELFQRKKYIEYPLVHSLLVCYETIDTEDGKQAVVFNDLKKLNFTYHSSTQPMDLMHIMAVLEQYAKFHAICFAMRDQSREFETLLQSFDRLDKDNFSEEKIMGIIERGIVDAIKALTEMNRSDLKRKFERFVAKGISRILDDVLSNVPDEWVITHGDGWNESFLFQNKDYGERRPPEVCILNWQFSTPHSPVLDLAMFLYFVSSREELLRFEQLVGLYHEHFSFVLSHLGSDPDRLFPFATLKDHWQRFASYAILLVVAGLPGICAGRGASTSVRETSYGDRVVAVLEHYFDSLHDEIK